MRAITKRTRFDFFDCATTHLFLESFTMQYYNWCNENNLKMTGHFMAEDNLAYQTQWIGSAMPHYQFMHWPGIDKLGRHIEQLVTVKQVTSAADQLDKERSFSEVFGCVGQQVSFYHRKWIADWQAALGISFVNHHLSLYSMRGERKRDYPSTLFYQQPWWEDEKTFADYIGRLSYAVSSGKRLVDILVLHPVESVWCEYSPLHKDNELMVESKIYDEPFEKLSKELIANKLDFHYGDEIIMENHARVENGKLIVGSHSYSTVIVPPSCTLRGNTLKLLEKFAMEAGKDRLMFIQTYPDRVDGEKKEISLIGSSLKMASIKHAITALDSLYPNRIQIIDRVTGKNAAEVIVHQRATEEGELILLSNTNEKRELITTIRIPGCQKLKILDLMSGKSFSAPAAYEDGYTTLEVTFYPAGSLLLYKMENEAAYQQAPALLDSGVAFGKFAGNTQVISEWKVSVSNENGMPLNDVTLYLDGVKVLDNQPVAKAWHDYFYKAPDGTPFKAEYVFTALEIPQSGLFAVIECAENLDCITLNGHKLKPLKERGELGALDKEKSWLDINFTKVPLMDFVKKGENILLLEGKKINNITGPGLHNRVKNFQAHQATEVEVIYIVGDFKVVDFDREAFAITKSDTKIASLDLTSCGYPFYAGTANFSAELDVKDKAKTLILKINHVNAASIKLYVNGREAGIKFWAPYTFDVTEFVHEGINKVEVVAAPTLFNLMGPNRVSGILDDTGVGPNSFVDFGRYTAKYELLPFGIGRCNACK